MPLGSPKSIGDTATAAHRCLAFIVLASVIIRLPTALVMESLQLETIENAACSFERTYSSNAFGNVVSVKSALAYNQLYNLIYHGICDPLLHATIFIITLVFNWSVAEAVSITYSIQHDNDISLPCTA